MKKLTIFLAFLLFVAFQAAAQMQITGTVTGAEDGLPIPGVSVVVLDNTTIGTTTDFDGNYSLTVPSSAETLVFSFVGMKTQEVLIAGQSVINVTLETETLGLDEVIVTGYSSIRKSEVTGSSVQVGGEELANMPVVSVDQALQGKVAGVNISSSSGTPGSVQDIRIRGVSSITAGNDPLYVIDGVPMVSGNTSATTSGSSLSILSSLNSNNIENITILKDASATAQYGARGANGVIVITTKSGKSGDMKINFNATYGVSNDAIEGPDVLTGAEREMLFYESLINTYGEAYGYSDQAGAQAFYETYPTSFGTDYTDWNAAGRPETDWADIITNDNAPMSEYNLSASGGGETINYYASLGKFSQEATVIGSEFDRYSGALNLDVKLSDNVKFSTINSASHSYQDGLLETSAYFSSPRSTKYFMPSIDEAYHEDGTIDYENTTLPNPLWIAQEDIDDSKFTRIISNNSLSWATPIKNLSYTTKVNIDYRVYNYKRYRNPLRGDGDGTNGYGWQAHNNAVNYVWQNSLDYNLTFSEHSFDFKFLQEYQENRYYYLEADADNFSDRGLTNLNSAGNPTTANSYFEDWYIGSYLGMIHYSYAGKYILDVNYRREGSSRFSDDNRWGNFWAVGAAWNVHTESFMAGLTDIVNNLKLRASYGVSGNANIDMNAYQPLLGYDADYTGTGAAYLETYGNDELSWETSYSLDIGMDIGLYNNRIRGSVGYYRRETKDMLLEVPLSLTSGFPNQEQNIGRMENKGLEIELFADVVRSSDFNVTIGGNIATNANEILELAQDPNGEDITFNDDLSVRRVEVGHPVYGWYMRSWAGVDPDTGDELWYINPEESDATTNNWNEAEQVWQGGSVIPTLTAGLNLHVDYKGFFVDINGYYAGGHKVYEGWHRYTQGTDVFPVLYYQGIDAILDRWQQPGDEGTRYGKFEYTGRPWQRHSKFLYDGDYFRLRDVTLGYDFDLEALHKVGIDGARLFVRGTNLYTWVKDENLLYDPEFDVETGQTGMATPPIKSYIIGINLNF